MAKVEGTGTVSSDAGKWWVVGLLGVISVAAGVLALAYPDITLLVLGLVLGINLILSATFSLALLWLSDIPTPGDPNLALKSRLGLRFALDTFGVLPGLGLVALALTVGWWTLGRRPPAHQPEAPR